MTPHDRRQNVRAAARADVKGGAILIEHLDILDLSHGGMRFCCTRRLSPGQSVDLVLRRDTLRVNRRGKVVRSTFVGAVKLGGIDHTSYEVAVAFEDAACDERLRAELTRLMQP